MKNYNTSLFSRALQIFGSKAGDYLSADVHPNIQPVVLLEPTMNIVRNAAANNATTATIYTTPTDKDFFLCSGSLSVIKDATATSTLTAITAFVDGVAQNILTIAGITLTVQQQQNVFQITGRGLKIDRGTVITVTNTTNVGNVSANACIQGYTEETTSS